MSDGVRYSPEFLTQFHALDSYLTDRSGPDAAGRYVERLLAFCDGLAGPPVIGHHRDDLLPGLMTRTFEGHRVVCFLSLPESVHVIATFHTRQHWESNLTNHPQP